MTAEYCQTVQLRVREAGLNAFADDEAGRRHLLECPQCFAALQHTGAPQTQERGPASEPEGVRFERALRRRSGRAWLLLVGVGALVLVVAAAWSLFAGRRTSSLSSSGSVEEQETPESLDGQQDEGGRDRRHRDEPGAQGEGTRNRFGIEGREAPGDPVMAREEAKQAAANAGIVGVLKAQVGSWSPPAEPVAEEESDAWLLKGARTAGAAGMPALHGLGKFGTGHGGGAQGYGEGYGAEGKAKLEHTEHEARPVDRLAALRGDDGERSALRTRTAPRRASTVLPASISTPAALVHPPSNPAEALLARYSTLDRLSFLDPNGYFANTYVPGDPELRALQARLHAYDRRALLPEAVRNARLDDGAQRTVQPFDAPSHAALSVYLSASERGLTARRRMLVQVGLQATPRYSGRRPAMNVGIVLDAREALDAAQSANVRALLAAFAAARDLGDKLSLFAAGPGGGLLVGAEDFRNGPLSVALERVTARRAANSVGLGDALQRALQTVRGSDDPNAPLGSSVVIVVAPYALGAQLAELEALARQGAVDGVPLSAFGVGPAADPGELAQLALAGQGNRRMIGAGADAAAAVDRELSAVARVVARAVRLRIRLAPGVRLVRVLGSHPLDQQQAQQVRDAENSIDQRIGKNLGIERDRGDDEEGVQIVIPSFYAGDAHALLLDVVADGPGPIADVTVRYKDLVQLGNGIARESLALPNLELARGALQRNVLENLVAFELAGQLREAGDGVRRGDADRPKAIMADALALLDSLDTVVPELRGDRELAADRALVGEYLALLGQLTGPQRELAADSLHFASLLKLQPRPEWDARIVAPPRSAGAMPLTE